jgi:uncharacterized protein
MTTTAPTYDKFLPEGIPGYQRPYWDSLRDHAVKVQRCDSCGAYRYVPKEICPKCQAAEATWTSIAGTGEIYTYTVVRRAPTKAFQADAPYAIVHVTMDEGFRMIGTIPETDPESVRIGQKVTVEYLDVTPDWTLLAFRSV